MHITHTDYLELPTALAATRAVLRDRQTWRMLPTGAEHIGEMWRWGKDLYTIRMIADCRLSAETDAIQSYRMAWTMTPATGIGRHVQVELTLYDAIVATHVVIQVTLYGGSMMLPWKHIQATRQIAAVVHASGAVVQTLLRQHAMQRERALVPAIAATGSPEGDTLVATPPDDWSTSFSGNGMGSPPGPADSPQALADSLRDRYPATVTHFEEMNALDHLERVCRLEHGWQRSMHGDYDTALHRVVGAGERGYETDYDLIYAGGGLGLIHAAVMAKCHGWRVLLFDRSEVGCVHREWNISRDELQALVDLGLVTWHELSDVVMREYRNGVVRFHRSRYSAEPLEELWMPTVLNIALDAAALLHLMRRKLEAAGGTVLDRRSFRQVRVSHDEPLRVEVELEPLNRPTATETYSARLLLDGMGTTSPLALLRHAGRPFAGVCPTVGTVARGFVEGNAPDEHDPTIGDILVSVADTQQDHQLIWEGFPGRDDNLTVYVFYYATLNDAWRPVSAHETFSLLDMFEQYFALLPTYKRPGPDFRHVKPVYGYIPGRHSLRRQEAPLLRGVLPVGDSAAQQSPLTFCGFGSHIRNLRRTTGLLDYALHHELLASEHLANINAFQTNVSLNWVFSRFMHSWHRPHSVNELQNVFLGTMNDVGIALATRFFQDRMRWQDYDKIVTGVLRRYPAIIGVAWQALGPMNILRWIRDYLNFSRSAAVAAVGQAAGPSVEQAAYGLLDGVAPALSLRLRGRYAEWRAMGWL